MSIRALNWVFQDFVDVSPKKVTSTMRHILTVLANFAGDEDESYPRQTTIARITGYTRQCVNKNLSRMETMGLITATGRTRVDGSTRSSEYHLNIRWDSGYEGPAPEDIDDDGGVNQDDTGGVNEDDTTVSQDDGGVAQDDTGCHRGRQGGVNQDDTINHHLEPSPEPKARTTIKRRKTAPWPEDFRDQFWNEVPRKVGRDAAIAKLERIEKADKVEFIDILEGMRRYANSPTVRADRADPERRRFIVHPVTWLNQGRWKDEEEPAKAKPRAVKRVAI